MSNSSPTNLQETGFGWIPYAETWNGRLAMIGLFLGLLTETLTGQGILAQLGLG